ncbi:MFS transporter [Nocardia sp. NPDC058176]|uniref:MFS transporter n=1 Tax=Nocardia sp. NPDC058176 TaxID=3346368 RepID=UPI0036DCA472
MTGRVWGMLLVLCAAIFLEGVDVSMMGVALPAIQADLGMTTGELQWVVSAYVLTYGGFMLMGGRAADLLGRRRMFLFWLAVFMVFSGLGAFAGEGWVLILSRLVKGVAAAFLTPAGLSIITTSFPEGRLRNKALLVYAGTAAAGFSLGLVVGGLLTTISWRWVFIAPVILTAAILAAAIVLVPKDEPLERSSGGFDLTGAISVTAAVLLLVLTVERSTHVGAAQTIGLLTLSAALLVVFVITERRSRSPLVRLGIFASGPLVRANLAAILFSGSFFAFQFIVVLYLQQLRGWSPLQTGLALLAIGIDAVLAPTLTPWLVNRYGNVRVILGGLVIAALAYALFQPMALDWTYAAMFPSMILLGLAFALVYGPLTIAATDGVDGAEQGLAGGLLNTSFQFGAGVGLAIVTAVSTAVIGGATTPDAILDGYRAALLVPVGAAVLGALVIAAGLRRTSALEPA